MAVAASGASSKRKTKKKKSKATGAVGVGIGFTFVQNITFDRGASVGTFEIELDVAAPKLLLVEILKATMPRAVVRYVRVRSLA